mgnify:CR=1 FL=1
MAVLEFFDCDVIVGRRNVVPADSFWDVASIRAAMERFNVTRAVIYHTVSEGGDAQRGNALADAEAEAVDNFLSSWVLGPPIPGEWPRPRRVVRNLLKSGARIARLISHAHLYPISVAMLEELLTELELRRVPLFVHSATVHCWTDQTDWRGLGEICEAFPHLPVVALRTGLRTTRPLYRMLERWPNFHVEFSPMTSNYRGLEHMVKNFGSERIIFGSIMPEYSPAIPVTQILYADLSKKDKRNIAGENLHRLIERVDV